MSAGRGLSHAWIVSSEVPERTLARARELAMELLCSGEGKRPCGVCRDCRKVRENIHPDLITIEREKKDGKLRPELYVSQIRAVSADAPVLPNEAGRKVYLFPEADRMNVPAQNALLKLLEEPPAHVAFILCAENPETLLETIRSRCARVSVQAGRDLAENAAAEDLFRALSLRSEEAMIRFCAEREEMDAASALDFVRAVQERLAAMLCLRLPSPGLPREELAELLGLFRTCERYLQSNVSVKHMLGLLQTLQFNRK